MTSTPLEMLNNIQLENRSLTHQLESYKRKIHLAGRFSAFLGVVLMLVIMDAIISGMDQSSNVYTGYPGLKQTFSGSTSRPIKSLDRLTVTSPQPGFRVQFIKAESSVWHHFWYGTLEISPTVRPGDYDLIIDFQPELSDVVTTHFTIRVYDNPTVYQKMQKSIITKTLDVSPWIVFLVTLTLFILSFLPVYRLSGRKEQVMRRLGRSVITNLKWSKEQWLVMINLGSEHGVQKHDRIGVYTVDGIKIGTISADQVMPDKTIAFGDSSLDIKPTHEIRI